MKSYKLPGIDSLRLFAALFIIPPHIEFSKLIYNGADPGEFDMGAYYTLLGDWAVTFIFVLSGFLITYLLLLEKEQYNTISLKHFFMRRGLRLLPLYLFLVFITLVVFPHVPFFRIEPRSTLAFAHQKAQLLLYVFGLANVAPLVYYYVPFLVQTWSIGSEEQFYFVWAPLVKNSKSLVRIALSVIAVYMTLHIATYILSKTVVGKWDVVEHFFRWVRMSSMCIGALFAWMHLTDHKWLPILFKQSFQLVLFAVLAVLVGFGVTFGAVHTEVYSVFFGIIILNSTTNPKALLKINNRFTEYFGKMAYGVYMYHFIAIHIAYKITTGLMNLNEQPVAGNVLLYVLSFVFSLCISFVSYHVLEKHFLKLKKQFQRIAV